MKRTIGGDQIDYKPVPDGHRHNSGLVSLHPTYPGKEGEPKGASHYGPPHGPSTLGGSRTGLVGAGAQMRR